MKDIRKLIELGIDANEIISEKVMAGNSQSKFYIKVKQRVNLEADGWGKEWVDIQGITLDFRPGKNIVMLTLEYNSQLPGNNKKKYNLTPEQFAEKLARFEEYYDEPDPDLSPGGWFTI